MKFRLAAAFVSASLVVTPAWAVTKDQTQISIMWGVMNAAAKLCQNYTVDVDKLEAVILSFGVEASDPETKRASLVGFNNLQESIGRRGQGECDDLYAELHKEVPAAQSLRGSFFSRLQPIMVPKR